MEFLDGSWKKEVSSWDALMGEELLNQEAILEGAIHSIRNMGDVAFVIIRRREGLFQTVFVNEDVDFSIHNLKEGMTVRVKGVVNKEERAPHGRELHIREIHFEIKRGERVAIIGNNGTGKTTILKILNEVIRPDVGSFTLGSRVQIGYYDQEHQVLHMEKTIFQEISDAYPYLTNTEIRNVLAAFLFTNDDVFQPIHTLSGGERGRISLAKLMLSNANFLILDEPTNHLDIVSKEILENALKDYTGTVLYVSHDRYFINQTATRILELTGQTLVNYIGNYDYYLEKKEELTRIYAPAADAAAPEEAAAPSEASSTKLDWKAQKEEQARPRKKENELKKTEKRIEELETRDSEIDEEMSKPEVATNVAECVKLSKEKAEIAAELEELYEKWEELAE